MDGMAGENGTLESLAERRAGGNRNLCLREGRSAVTLLPKIGRTRPFSFNISRGQASLLYGALNGRNYPCP